MVGTNVVVNVAKEFSPTLGARMKMAGRNSGEDFFEKFSGVIEEAYRVNNSVTFNFDGCIGFPSSFFNEAFVRFANSLEIEPIQLWSFISIYSKQHEWLSDQVKEWVLS